ncbi:MAG TPA: class I SAM-dependent methyltransferase [Nitrospiraceae bacterium]|nr:class I SAM-dependent methyltransferase [Nitrospiraceae bacterium]
MPIDQKILDTFLGQAVSDLAAGYGGVMISLGHRLGLYKAMAGAGPLNSQEVAQRAGCSERYVREWLNSQAAGGYVKYHAGSETYELPPEQAFVLADEESPLFLPPAWNVPASMWFDEEKVARAIRTGEGLAWRDHHGRLSCGVAAFYRNCYRGSLLQQWLPALPGVIEKLENGAKVADVGCGHGHSTLLMAAAFPHSRFWGYDNHEESVVEARENARRSNAGSSVTFEIATARSYSSHGFDLICFFDCLHDMGDPVAAAEHAREALAQDGTVMLVEPFAGDRVEENLTPIGRLYYAASTAICCPHSLSEDGKMALGAQAGEARLRAIFHKAGFRTFRRATQTPFNLVLEAKV